MLDDIKDIDINDIGSWPNSFKMILVGLFCVAIIAATWWFVVKEKKQVELEKLVQTEQTLKSEFLEKNKLAKNLDAYKDQMVEAGKMFDVLKEQLPSEGEIPDLLEVVSQRGLSRGLQFQSFQPVAEVPREFYVEKPVNIVVTGNYHQLAEFVSDVAEMSRIVSVDDFDISREKDGDLKMIAVTKTYYYDDASASDAGENELR